MCYTEKRSGKGKKEYDHLLRDLKRKTALCYPQKISENWEPRICYSINIYEKRKQDYAGKGLNGICNFVSNLAFVINLNLCPTAKTIYFQLYAMNRNTIEQFGSHPRPKDWTKDED